MAIPTSEASHVVDIRGVRVLLGLSLAVEENDECAANDVDSLDGILKHSDQGFASYDVCLFHRESIALPTVRD